MALFSKLFTGANDREVKKLNPVRRRGQRPRDRDAGAERRRAARQDGRVPRRASRRRRRPSTTSCPRPSPSSARRSAADLGQRAFDTQLLGAIVLHQGKIAELKTGEGKTLVAALAMYLNALDGRGAHLITVNDYLAKRDAQWYGRVLAWLGVSVGVLQHDASLHRLARGRERRRTACEYLTPCSPSRCLRRRHHLRHEPRVRLRLPARQHGDRRGATRCSASATSPSSTRWTTSSSTRRARR